MGVAVSITLLATATPARAWADRGVRFVAAWDGFSAIVTGCDGTCPANLVIPSSVFHPGFYDDLPVREIDGGAFQDRQLSSVTIPDSVSRIGFMAFANNNLTKLAIPNSVTSIGSSAFANNNLTAVTIGSSVTSIGSSAFANNNLTVVTIGSSVTSISAEAFADNSLTSVTIPTNVTSIGAQAFARNSLITVTIPYWVGSIGDWAFADNNLINVIFLGAAPAAGGGVFDGNAGLTAIKRTTASSGWGATWSDVPVVIASGFTYDVGGGAATVTGCIGPCPATLEIPAVLDGYSVTMIGDFAFDNEALASDGLVGVTIPSSVTSIGESAFENNSLANVVIPNSVTSIGSNAFFSNVLTSVYFEGSVPTAGTGVFTDNPSLAHLTRRAEMTDWGRTWGGLRVLIEGDRLANGFTYRVIGGAATVTDCAELCPRGPLVIPETLDGLTVTSIAYQAFMRYRITSVSIPNSVTSIGDYAFYYNSLSSVTIPNSVTSIGSGAFAANRISSLTIGSSVTNIGTGAFSSNFIWAIAIPNSVTTIGEDAFRYNKITSITIARSVTTIGSYAFASNRISHVTFEGNAPTAGTGVFSSNTDFSYRPVLLVVTRPATATGWGTTWSGVRVVVAIRATATVKPTITGTARNSQTLTAKKGTWRGAPTPTYTYQWYACTKAVTAARTAVPSTCTAVTGATRSTLKLTAAQRNKYVAVLVTGTSVGTTATTWLSRTTSKIR